MEDPYIQQEDLVRTPKSNNSERRLSAANSEEERLSPEHYIPSSSEAYGDELAQRASHQSQDEKVSSRHGDEAVQRASHHTQEERVNNRYVDEVEVVLVQRPSHQLHDERNSTRYGDEAVQRATHQTYDDRASTKYGDELTQRASHQVQETKVRNESSNKRAEVVQAEANFQESLEKLRDLVEEEEMVITKIEEIFQKKGNADTEDLMEALLYEFRVRANDEKNVIIDLGKYQNQIDTAVGDLLECQKKDIEEAERLRKMQEVKALRQIGTYKKFQDKQNNGIPDDSEMYDWLVDINLLTDVCKGKGGWKVEFSPHFCTYNQEYIAFSQKKALDSNKAISNSPRASITSTNDPVAKNKSLSWEGAIVSVVGLYDKGKTFVMNNITNSNLPSGKKVNTKGLSFKHVNVDNGTNLVLLDTAGSYSPVRVVDELSVLEKEATEMFILDMVFEISDYFICVVNDFTSLDQRYLDKIARNLQNSPTKTFREVIVVHNLKEVDTQEVLDHLWTTQVTQIYGSGSIQKTKVAAVNLETKKLEERHVVWFKTNYTRHICLCNDDSPLGSSINAWAFSLLKYWLKTVFVPVNRPFSVIDSVMTQAATKLSLYFRMNVNLSLEETSDPLIRYIQTNSPIQDSSSRIPQISTDSTGFVISRPDNFLPQVDIVQGNEYIIYMDVSGLSKEDIIVSRQNTITIVKGNRKKPKDLGEGTLEKNERKYGEFTMTFKIPDIYERKWKGCIVENGVLKIWYPKDESENDDIELGDDVAKDQ